ncbi:hypothetical protein AaE_002123, partial [Aphanomyces astaci]
MAPTIEDIAAALYRFEKGESVVAVARSSNIKRTMIHKYKKMKKATGSITIGKQGLKPLLPSHLEKDLVTWIAVMQRAGWPVERYEVMIKANKILNHHFSVPRSVGRGWYARFENRHHDLSARMAQKLSKARNAVMREGIT